MTCARGCSSHAGSTGSSIPNLGGRRLERLGECVFGDAAPPDAETGVLVALADAAGLLQVHFPEKRLRDHRQYLGEIAAGHIVSDTVSRAIREAMRCTPRHRGRVLLLQGKRSPALLPSRGAPYAFTIRITSPKGSVLALVLFIPLWAGSRGVAPSPSFAFTLAPASSRTFTVSGHPLRAAA